MRSSAFPGARACLACVFGVVLGGLAVSGPDLPAAGGTEPRRGPRRPVALAVADGGRRVVVANRGGSLSVIDTETLRPAAEVTVGRRLSDLVATPDGARLLATDEEADELVILSLESGAPKAVGRVAVAPSPVSVRLLDGGARAVVVSLWPRRLTVVDLRGEQGPRARSAVDLPFSPRQAWPLGGDRVVVADAFGGRLAVVDVEKNAVESVRTIPGHNVRGLALGAGGSLLVAHQVLNRLSTTSRDDVHWGNLITNNLRAVPLETILDTKADLLRGSHLFHLGEAGHGAADPSAVSVTPDGTVVVALAGVGELAVGREKEGGWRYVAVGARPAAVALSPDGGRAFVANTFSDSVSVVGLKQARVEATVALGTADKPTAEDRGEALFRDARLSHDGWMSCHSCHTDGHTNGQLNDNASDGSSGTPKRVLSLLGARDTGPWAWNGSMPDLETQVRRSVSHTMQGPKLTAEQVRDLTAFLGTLAPPPPAKEDAVVRRGREVFEKLGCAACHAPPTYTTAKTYDVGLADESGQRSFNPPSLRGAAHGGPYFHDGRAATLEDVVVRHRHQIKDPLSKKELEDLLGFLERI